MAQAEAYPTGEPHALRNIRANFPRATDDEILGIASPRKNPPRASQQLEFDFDAADAVNNADGLRPAGVPPAPLHSAPASADNNSKTPAGGRRYEDQLESAPQDLPAAPATLPEFVAKNARTRVVGEIYRELDSSLRANPQFAAQLRDAFRSGSLDDAHQRAIVSLLTGRARQALPGVAKRVLSEWVSTIMSAANERRTRQRTAERRIDIAGSSGAGNDGRKSMSPRDLDYARLTDADILNL